jgi:hypothetical protein
MSGFPCPCCGHLTFKEPPGSDDICPVCFWEDDSSQLRFPLTGGGANRVSLSDAQSNYRESGASEVNLVRNCRPATTAEPVEDGWRPFDPGADNAEIPIPGTEYGLTYPSDSTELYYWRSTYWRRAR